MGNLKSKEKERWRRGWRRGENRSRSSQLEHPRIKFARRTSHEQKGGTKGWFPRPPGTEAAAGRAIRSNFPRRVRGTRRGVATNLRSPPDLEARRQQTNYGKTIRPRAGGQLRPSELKNEASDKKEEKEKENESAGGGGRAMGRKTSENNARNGSI